MHDVHMNQGNDPCHLEQDGTWQDGAVLIEHTQQQRWTGIFLKFQSQSWHTDNVNGHTRPLLEELFSPAASPECYGPNNPEYTIRIIAALVNPSNGDPPHESVTLLNVSPYPVNLAGWRVTGGEKGKWPLQGKLRPGETREFPLGPAQTVGNNGGIVTLLNREGAKIHGIYYTAEQAARKGWRIPF